MCNPSAIVAAIGAGASLYGNKRSVQAQNNAQFRKFEFDTARQSQEFLARLNQDRQVFGAEQTRAQEQQAAQHLNQQRQAELSQRQAVSQGEQIQAQENEFQSQQQAVRQAIEPTAEIADAAANAAAISGAQSDLEGVIDQSAVAGEQAVGTGESFGRVSDDFESSAADSEVSNISRAKRRARQIGTGIGISNLQQTNADSIADAGFGANLVRAKAGRDLTFAQQVAAQEQGSINRQQQLNQLLFDIDQGAIDSNFSLAQRGAEIDNALPPDDFRFINPNNRSAQLYSALGGALSAFGNSGASLFGGGVPGGGGVTVNSNPQTLNRFAGIA